MIFTSKGHVKHLFEIFLRFKGFLFLHRTYMHNIWNSYVHLEPLQLWFIFPMPWMMAVRALQNLPFSLQLTKIHNKQEKKPVNYKLLYHSQRKWRKEWETLGKVLIKKSLKLKIIIFNLKGNGKKKETGKGKEFVCMQSKKLQQFNVPHQFFSCSFIFCFHLKLTFVLQIKEIQIKSCQTIVYSFQPIEKGFTISHHWLQ